MKTKKPTGNIRHLIVAVAIMTAGISSIAWLNPAIKNGKITINKAAYPAIIKRVFTDTVIKKMAKVEKIAARNKKTKVTKPYSVSQYGITNDEELAKLTAEISKHSMAMQKYYDSPEFKQQMELIAQKGKAIEAYYNRPDIRKLHDEQEQLGKSMEGNSAQMGQVGKQMEESGKIMSAFYNSPAFDALINRLEKKYNIPHKRYYVSRDSADWSDNYKKFQAEIAKNMPADVKQQQEIISRLSVKMRGLYDTPEFRESRKKLQALGDSLKGMSADNDIKQQQIELGVLSQKMKSLQNDAALQREQRLLKEASKKLEQYTNSPEFKKRMDEYRKAIDAALKDDNNRKDYNPIPFPLTGNNF